MLFFKIIHSLRNCIFIETDYKRICLDKTITGGIKKKRLSKKFIFSYFLPLTL